MEVASENARQTQHCSADHVRMSPFYLGPAEILCTTLCRPIFPKRMVRYFYRCSLPGNIIYAYFVRFTDGVPLLLAVC